MNRLLRALRYYADRASCFLAGHPPPTRRRDVVFCRYCGYYWQR